MHPQAVDFLGAKVALLIGDKLLVILRDDIPGIVWPGHWDLPGGGREGTETPFETVARETREEVGLILPQGSVLSCQQHPAETKPGAVVFLFLAHLPAHTAADIRLGDEGQMWQLMAPQDYAAHPLRIPHFADRVLGIMAENSLFTGQ